MSSFSSLLTNISEYLGGTR